MNRLKVTLIYLGRRGGGALYSLEVAKALAKKVDLLAVVSRQALNLENWRKSGLVLFEVDTYNSAWGVLPSTLNLKKYLSIRQQIHRFKPNILYYPMLHIWTPLINWLLPSVPKIITIHDPILHKGERNPILSLIQQIAIRQATRIIILSRAFVLIMEQQGLSREQIDVIPHGDFSHYALISGDLSLQRTAYPPTLLFFGRILKYKGLEILLSAFPLIKNQVPEARLLIAGEGDLRPYEAQLAALKDVTIVNRWINDEEIAIYFRQANVLVVPYTDTSQSGVIPIAYSFKVPVVATRVGGIPEQVEDGKSGLLVSPGNIEQLADACIKLLVNPIMAQKMGQEGWKIAMKDWSWDCIANQLLESFEKAVRVG